MNKRFKRMRFSDFYRALHGPGLEWTVDTRTGLRYMSCVGFGHYPDDLILSAYRKAGVNRGRGV